jgi:glyoxylase-like metal-dependent hydrolase (beta-lactamase superfamily II)
MAQDRDTMPENRGKFTREASQAYLAAEPEMAAKQLSERIWTASDGHCRTLFAEGDGSVLAFDSFGTPGRARAYRRSIEAAIPDKPIKTVIYTHDHLDHTGFAADLAPDANIIADEICAKVIKLRQAEGQLPPTMIVTGTENRMNIDGVEFTLLNPGPTHGSGNISAHFAAEKILFSSDTILANAKYGFMPDYHFTNFVKFMRGFLELDWETFVPGRFELTHREGFERGCELIQAVQTESQNAFAGFVPIWAYEPMQGYVSQKLADRFGDMDGFDDHIGQMAIRIVHHYLMGGWGLEDTPEPEVLLADQVSL